MEQRVSVITLGANDVQKSAALFERLGWRRSEKHSRDEIVWFPCGGLVFALYGRAALAQDAGVSPKGEAFSGITLAYNTRSKADVEDVLAKAKSAGAEIVKPAQDVFWGGYSGYFRDLDGHLWEVAWNLYSELDDGGALKLME